MMNILLGGMAGDGPPEPPPPRTKDARIVLSWFSVAAGTMLLLSRIESSFLQDAPPDEDRLQLAWCARCGSSGDRGTTARCPPQAGGHHPHACTARRRRLVKHLSIPGILGSLLVLHGLSRLAARGKRRQAARLGLLSAALLAFASLSKLGVLHQANAKVALPGLGLLILVAWTAVGKVLGGEDDEEEEDARGGREGPADARAAAIDKDGSVVHHSGAAVGGAGGARARSGAAAGPATTSGQ